MDNSKYRGAVVVGVDGSPDANRAVEWAAWQADRDGRRLVVVHGARATDTDWLALWTVDRDRVDRARYEASQAIVDDAVTLAATLRPDVEVQGILVDADPRAALVDAAESAHLVVVGRRGLSPWRSVVMGSVSTSVSRHADCPTLVTGEGLPASISGVVVGAAGTPESGVVIEQGFHQAALHDVPLTVVHCFWDIAGQQAYGATVHPEELGVEDLRLLVSESVAGFATEFPDVEVHLELARGLVDLTLTDAAPPDSLLVVGRGHATSWLGHLRVSTALAVLDQAHGPVEVVPEARP